MAKIEHIKVKIDQTKLRNEMHFDVQRNNHAIVYRDRTKYTRKRKHKNAQED